MAFLFRGLYAKIDKTFVRRNGGAAMKMGIVRGRVIDPGNFRDEICDILIEDGLIKKVGTLTEEVDRLVDAEGKCVMPGFIDLHVHLREPGGEKKETIETGTRAAAAGGVTTLCAMPNTFPVMDTPEKVLAYKEKCRREALIDVLPIGAVTLAQDGNTLTDFKGMLEAGVCAFSEDGKSVMSSELAAEAFHEAAKYGALIMAHCEDKPLVRGGVMNAGKRARELNLPGITNAVEDVVTARDVFLAGEAFARLHICHASTRGAIKLVEEGKKLGYQVSAEVCPHHFTLSDRDIPCDDPNYKMNPPLRSARDVQALREGLKGGCVDAIATDHAPHTKDDKGTSMRKSAFGITGLETSAALVYTELVEKGVLSLSDMVDKMSYQPAKILRLCDRGVLSEGKRADIVIFDPQDVWTIDPDAFYSKGRNTPFGGRRVKGRVVMTIKEGKPVYESERGIIHD